MKKSDRKVIKM